MMELFATIAKKRLKVALKKIQTTIKKTHDHVNVDFKDKGKLLKKKAQL